MNNPASTSPPHYYWVAPGKLLAGPYPGSITPETAEERQRELIAHGIRHVLNLMEEDETNGYGEPFTPYADALGSYAAESNYAVTCQRISVRDMDVPSRETMHRILDAIDAAITDGQPVYVHCWGGVGRTGTAVGCWMVRHGIVRDGEEALDRIKELRRGMHGGHLESPQTEAQCRMVRSWKPGE